VNLEVSGKHVGRVVKQPLGFCRAPFNFPALVFGWFIPAIGVGNTFIFKNDAITLFMQKWDINDIGLPPGS
jgi:malonate-semialdehyde dehydrogenase (acetylating)/methylmalonate-semialdehyde dehydrogenase